MKVTLDLQPAAAVLDGDCAADGTRLRALACSRAHPMANCFFNCCPAVVGEKRGCEGEEKGRCDRNHFGCVVFLLELVNRSSW